MNGKFWLFSELCNAPVLSQRSNSSWGSHWKDLHIFKSPSRVLAIDDSLEGLPGLPAEACSPWTALAAVKFTWAFHLLCWLPKYFQDQITGLRRNLSNSNREMRNAQAVRRWQLGDVNVNFGVYFATSTLLISSGLWPSLVKCSNLQQKHSWWALYSVCLIIHARWKLYRQD